MTGQARATLDTTGSVRTIGDGRDLTESVTVFVTTVGAPTFERCLAQLAAQDVIVRFEVIDHVAPITAALQHMLDRCATEFFVQVDEDMLLEPDAVGRLYDLIAASWRDTAIVVGQLFDTHLERPIEGVKIHRTALVRPFPWSEFATVQERNRALEAAGNRVARRPVADSGQRLIFGTHELDPAPTAILRRYLDLELLRLANPERLAWFEPYPAEFLRRLRTEPREIDLYALVGVMAARANPHQPRIKDFRRTDAVAVAAAAAELWSALSNERAG